MPTDFIDHCALPEALVPQYVYGEGGPFLTRIGKVNIFVGPNNAGKSRFLRALFTGDLRGLPEAEQQLAKEKLRRKFFSWNQDMSSYSWEDTQSTPPWTGSSLDGPWPLPEWVNRNFSRRSPEGIIANITKSQRSHAELTLKKRNEEILYDFKSALKPVGQSAEKLYIPTLRGLRPPTAEKTPNSNGYTERTRKDYFKDKDARFVVSRIFTGLNLYEDVKAKLLSERANRDLVRRYEDFLSEEFFPGQTVSLTPEKDEDVVRVELGRDEHLIHEYGDGLQQMIIMTFPVVMRPDKHVLLFIEEPELYLHPGMQRQFLDLFTREDGPFKDTQVFMTTHSNHFLDMTFDMDRISVYRFSKQSSAAGTAAPPFHIENVSNTDHNLLRDLGVHNSSVFLTNCTIWVEGVTDRIYLRKYLELYQAEKVAEDKPSFREDVHYTVCEYAGANVDHWFFGCEEGETTEDDRIRAERLCGGAFLIADKDEEKEERHKRRKEELGDRYHVLESREIENLLDPGILVSAIKSYSACKDKGMSEPSEREAYQDKKIGKYIDEEIFDGDPPRKFAVSSSGMLTDKVNFARKACEAMKKYDDLSGEAKSLAQKVYEFIEKMNPAGARSAPGEVAE